MSVNGAAQPDPNQVNLDFANAKKSRGKMKVQVEHGGHSYTISFSDKLSQDKVKELAAKMLQTMSENEDIDTMKMKDIDDPESLKMKFQGGSGFQTIVDLRNDRDELKKEMTDLETEMQQTDTESDAGKRLESDYRDLETRYTKLTALIGTIDKTENAANEVFSRTGPSETIPVEPHPPLASLPPSTRQASEQALPPLPMSGTGQAIIEEESENGYSNLPDNSGTADARQAGDDGYVSLPNTEETAGSRLADDDGYVSLPNTEETAGSRLADDDGYVSLPNTEETAGSRLADDDGYSVMPSNDEARDTAPRQEVNLPPPPPPLGQGTASESPPEPPEDDALTIERNEEGVDPMDVEEESEEDPMDVDQAGSSPQDAIQEAMKNRRSRMRLDED